MASSTFSLLGKENDWEDFLRNRSELRGVCEGVVFNCSLPQPSLSSLSLLESLTCFLNDLVFLLSSSESEDKRDLFKDRCFFVDKLSGSSSSSSLEAPIFIKTVTLSTESMQFNISTLHASEHVLDQKKLTKHHISHLENVTSVTWYNLTT